MLSVKFFVRTLYVELEFCYNLSSLKELSAFFQKIYHIFVLNINISVTFFIETVKYLHIKNN